MQGGACAVLGSRAAVPGRATLVGAAGAADTALAFHACATSEETRQTWRPQDRQPSTSHQHGIQRCREKEEQSLEGGNPPRFTTIQAMKQKSEQNKRGKKCSS